MAPDVLAAELPVECAAARGLYDVADGSEAMLSALGRCWAGHRRSVESSRRAAPQLRRMGERRLAEHVERLSRRWGDRLDLSSLGVAGDELVRLYESGERVELRVGGAVRRATVGCTSGCRPEFVYLVSLPVLEVEAA